MDDNVVVVRVDDNIVGIKGSGFGVHVDVV